jgi:hypothetical protein
VHWLWQKNWAIDTWIAAVFCVELLIKRIVKKFCFFTSKISIFTQNLFLQGLASRSGLCLARLPSQESSTSFPKRFIKDLSKVLKEFFKILEFQQQTEQNIFKNVKNNASNQTHNARMKEHREQNRWVKTNSSSLQISTRVYFDTIVSHDARKHLKDSLPMQRF